MTGSESPKLDDKLARVLSELQELKVLDNGVFCGTGVSSHSNSDTAKMYAEQWAKGDLIKAVRVFLKEKVERVSRIVTQDKRMAEQLTSFSRELVEGSSLPLPPSTTLRVVEEWTDQMGKNCVAIAVSVDRTSYWNFLKLRSVAKGLKEIVEEIDRTMDD
jgi:hypothetical protein